MFACPFSTIVVGRYGSLAPAVCLYAGHLLLIALRMMALMPHLEAGDHLRSKQMGAMLLVASALLTIVLSFINPRIANVRAGAQFRTAGDRHGGGAGSFRVEP
jgi:TMEM175 potassium channel family protein